MRISPERSAHPRSRLIESALPNVAVDVHGRRDVRAVTVSASSSWHVPS